MKTATVAVIGDPGSGKSCLLDTLSHGSIGWSTHSGFPGAGVTTTFSAEWENDHSQVWDLELCDTSGSADPLSIAAHAAVIVLVYDMNSASGLQQLHSEWLPRLKGTAQDLVLVGAKHDQWTEQRRSLGHVQTSVKQGKHMAELLGARAFVVTSAKNKYGLSSETPDITTSTQPNTLPRVIMKLCESVPQTTVVNEHRISSTAAVPAEHEYSCGLAWDEHSPEELQGVLSDKQHSRCAELFSFVDVGRQGSCRSHKEEDEEHTDELVQALSLFYDGVHHHQLIDAPTWIRYWAHMKLSMGDLAFARWLKRVSVAAENTTKNKGKVLEPMELQRKGWFSSKGSSVSSTPRRPAHRPRDKPRWQPAPERSEIEQTPRTGKSKSGFERVEAPSDSELWLPVMKSFKPTGTPAPKGQILAELNKHSHFDLTNPSFCADEEAHELMEQPLDHQSEYHCAVQQSQTQEGLDGWLDDNDAQFESEGWCGACLPSHSNPVDQIRSSYSGFRHSETRFQRAAYGAVLKRKEEDEEDLANTFGTVEAEEWTKEQMSTAAKNDNKTFEFLEQTLNPQLQKQSKATRLRSKAASLHARDVVKALDVRDKEHHLIAAVRRGDTHTVKSLLAAKCRPDVLDVEGRPLICMAAYTQREAVIDALLDAGADPRDEDRHGDNAIEIAVQACRPDLAARLQAVMRPKAPELTYNDARNLQAERNIDALLQGAGLRVFPTSHLMEAAYTESFHGAVLQTETSVSAMTSRLGARSILTATLHQR
eukprot:TRINITY_DN16306_c0_g1_i2.p1 TRINITY_DN16306_c0_g1~~TRINITY_DN16306_c0_g1_i2.p1  ORF type:complete len:764 (-),score=189.43 TRINITY_DN16306_c0_g1_i2:131-2422(-)